MALKFGQITTPQTTVLVHVDNTEPVVDVINGHTIELPPNEPVELEPFVAEKVMDHKGDIHGIVVVQQVKDKAGTRYLLEEALDEAEEKLERCMKASIDGYVNVQMQDRIAAGRPALPPNGRPLILIKKLGISLGKQFGLHPVGWKDPGQDAPYGQTAKEAQSGVVPDQSALVAALMKQNELLMRQTEMMQNNIEGLQKRFEQLADMIGAGEDEEEEPNTPAPIQPATSAPAPAPATKTTAPAAKK